MARSEWRIEEVAERYGSVGKLRGRWETGINLVEMDSCLDVERTIRMASFPSLIRVINIILQAWGDPDKAALRPIQNWLVPENEEEDLEVSDR